jgi:rod shape-determining protein MreD
VSYYVGLTLMFVASVAEVSVLPLFRVSGLQPDLILVILVAWLMLRGGAEAFVFVPIAGLFLGLMDGAPLGTAMLALAPLFLLHDARGSQLRESGLILSVVFCVVMTIVFHLIYLAVFTFMGENGSWLEAALRVILPTAFLNVVLLLPVYFVISRASEELRRPTYA